MKKRIPTFFILWALVIGLVVTQCTVGTFLFISVLGLAAQWEFYRMQEGRGFRVFKKAGLACGALLFCFSYLDLGKGLGATELWRNLELIVVLAVILGLLTRQIFEQDQSQAVLTLALTFFGFFYVPYLFHYMLEILFWRGADIGFALIIYIIVITKLTDAGAYLAGSFLGRHKMSPHISPRKTWEGFCGGLAVAVLSSVLMVRFMPNLYFLGKKDAWILGLILGVVSVIGDLGGSVVKRASRSKDSGEGIPGIGGSLDLIDSLLFTAPMFYAYLKLLVE